MAPERLAAQAAEALRLEKFKDAIELFKQLVKQDPLPQWREGLAEAYVGRARALAAKGMFKEAEIVLANAAQADGSARDPVLLTRCLVAQGQLQKALSYLLEHLPRSGEDGRLDELAAALFLAFPVELRDPLDAASPRAIWLRAAAAAKEALDAFVGARPEAEVDALLAKIPLNSPFKAARLILKSLLLAPRDGVKARRLLEGVAADSPFASLRLAADAVIASASEGSIAGGEDQTAARRRFVFEAGGLSGTVGQTAMKLAEAEAVGPRALFSFLVKHAEQFDAADLRSACRDLLPRASDRMQEFEKRFGPLEEGDKQRILALAAEAAGRWENAERSWRAAAMQLETDGSARARLSAGVVYRHLAGLARRHNEIEGDDFMEDPVLCYLRKSVTADPDHVQARHELIGLLRDSREEERKDWHAQADAAAAAFPKDSATLLLAIDSAVERKAFKKAAGYARKLLEIDPINLPARQRMIDLQIAQARKQLRAKRPDLAEKALAEALPWERSDRPSAALRLNRGLLGLYGERGAEAEALLRDGVALAGGDAVGWFRAAIEEALLAPPGRAQLPLLRDELARFSKRAPEKREIIAIAAAFGATEVKLAAKATANIGWKFGSWLRKAEQVEFTTGEFHLVAEALLRAQLFDVLGDFAAEARRREPGEPAWRFYRIVARTENNPDWMTVAEEDEIFAMGDDARTRDDYAWFSRIQRYLDSSGDDPAARRRARRIASPGDVGDAEIGALIAQVFDAISPDDVRRLIKKHGPDGARQAIVAKLAEAPALRGLPSSMLAGFAAIMIESAAESGASPF